MLINTGNKKLICLSNHAATDFYSTGKLETIAAITCQPVSKFEQLFDSFPALIKRTFHLKKMPHGVELSINTQGPPLYCRPRRLAPDQYEALKHEFKVLL